MRKYVLYSVFAISCFLMLTSGVEDDNGKAGRTGSPNEQTCVDGCHNSYALNSGSGNTVITSNIPNWEYTPGTSYTINVTCTHQGAPLFGMGFEALKTGNTNGGTLTPGTGTQIKTSGGKTNIVHQLNGGATANSHTFTFTWVAPASGTGNVNFYWANVAGSGGNGNKFDYVYTGTQLVTEFVPSTSVQETSSSFNFLNVFPNPVSDNLNINYSLKSNEKATAKIFSLDGKLVREISETITGHLQTNVADLNKGIYLLEVKAGDKSETKRIVIE